MFIDQLFGFLFPILMFFVTINRQWSQMALKTTGTLNATQVCVTIVQVHPLMTHLNSVVTHLNSVL